MNVSSISPTTLAEAVIDARWRSLELLTDLDDDQLLGPHLPIVNPLLWEMGHLAWFGEKWVLRHAGKRPPLRSDADSLFDSSAVLHDTRWDLRLLPRAATGGSLRQSTRGGPPPIGEVGRVSAGARMCIACARNAIHLESFSFLGGAMAGLPILA